MIDETFYDDNDDEELITYEEITYEELGWERIYGWGLFREDFEIIRYKDSGKYKMFIETMIGFDSDEGLQKYVNDLLDTFTKWMINNGHDTSKRLDMNQVFSEGLNVKSEFESLEELYATLHFLFNGFSGSGLIVNSK